MKTSNTGIASALAGTSRFAADLYTFFFAEGTAWWTGGDADLSFKANLFTKSEPVLADFPTKSAGITQGALTDLGLSNGATYPAGATDQYAYEQPTLVSGVTYTVSAFVKMADLSAPALSAVTTSGDMGLVIDGTLVTAGLMVSLVAGSLYRVSGTRTSASTGARSCGVVRYAGQTAKSFTVTGYQIEQASGVGAYVKTAGAAYTPTWLASGPVLARTAGRNAAGLQVDEMTITLAPGTRTIGTVTAKQAALNGSFDNVRVLVQRAFMLTWGTIPGLVTIFDGTAMGVDPSSSSIRIAVRSKLARLSTQVPKRLMQPQCSHLLFDADCALSPGSWVQLTTLTGASTASVVVQTASQAYAEPGAALVITGGALAGQTRVIQSVSGASLTLSRPLPSAPSGGDAVSIYRACDKSRGRCRTFGVAGTGNIAHFGGFPDTPKQVVVQTPHPHAEDPP